MQLIADKKYNLLIVAVIIITGAITYPSTQYLLQEWLKWDQALSQGFACLGLVAFFIWRLPLTNSLHEQSASRLWLVLLLGSSCAWCVAQLGNLQLPAYLISFLIIIFFLASCINLGAFKKLLPVLGLFLFALPIWSGDILLELSSLVVSSVLQLSDLTMHIQDNHILMPWGTIVIADGCSGLRYFIISLLLAYLLCLLNSYSIKTGVIVFSVAIVLALITNWVRITLLVLIGYHTEMTHSLVREHEFFGWILFAIIVLPALYLAPQKKLSIIPIPLKFRLTTVVILAWLSGPFIYFFIPFHPAKTNPIDLAFNQDFPAAKMYPELFLHYPPADQVNNKAIEINGIPIHIEIMLLAAKHKNEKVVPYMGDLFNKSIWQNVATEKTLTSQIVILEQRTTKQKILLAYRYQVGPWKTPNYAKAKLLQIPAKLTNQAYYGFWSAQAICNTDCTNEINAMKELSTNW